MNYQELERVREEMWKALEEHEKALLDQEEAEKRAGEEARSEEEEEEEEGMFSDLKDFEIDDELFAQLEPSEKVDTASDTEKTATKVLGIILIQF